MVTEIRGLSFALLLIVGAPILASAQPAAAPAIPAAPAAMSADTSKIDPAKLTDIKKLIVLTGGDQIGKQIAGQIVDSFKYSFAQVPADFWAEFLTDDRSKELVDVSAVIYDKYLTHDEIKDVLKFYESTVGKKLIEVLPNVAQDSYVASEEWGYKLGSAIQQKLLSAGHIKPEDLAPPAAPGSAAPGMPAASTTIEPIK